jgi:hypothetical protein
MSLVIRVVSFSILGAAALVGTVALIISNRTPTHVRLDKPQANEVKREVSYKVWKGSVKRKGPTPTNQTNQRHDMKLGEVNIGKPKLMESEFERLESVKATIEEPGLRRRETYKGEDHAGREPVIAVTGVEEKDAVTEKPSVRYAKGPVSEEDALEIIGFSPLLTSVVDTKHEDDWTLVSDEEHEDDLMYQEAAGEIKRNKSPTATSTRSLS